MPALDTTTTLLSEWNSAIDGLMDEGRYEEALTPIQVILRQLPRHLATYEKLLQVAWQLRHWNEGMLWSARLLRADPGNALAWRVLAMATEQHGNRAKARMIWQRAFEASPYHPEARTGLSRTTLDKLDSLILNQACLASLHLRNKRWEEAGHEYHALFTASQSLADASPALASTMGHLHDALTNNLQINLMIALWQSGQKQHAYQIAHSLVRQKRNLLFPWHVLNNIGDANDMALAYNPLQQMDPDGAYIATRMGIDMGPKFIELEVTTQEVELLGMIG